MSQKLNAFQIYNLLPKTNCKECGEATCMAFAIALLRQAKKIDDCPPLKEPKYEDKLKKLHEIFDPIGKIHKSGITINDDLCTGCGNCVIACPVEISNIPSIARGEAPDVENEDNIIFRVIDGKVKICNLDICRRVVPPRMACDVCEHFCMSKAIKIYGN
ncbi:MAG: (Fe-S)-binding protein [Candidatus Helarchaeota archaeon]